MLVGRSDADKDGPGHAKACSRSPQHLSISLPGSSAGGSQQTGCTSPADDDYVDSLLALKLSDGTVAWADHTLNGDLWTLLQPTGPDFDFGAGPNLFTTANPVTGRPEQLLGAGQKSGVYWAVDPATGRVAWQTRIGPSGDVTAWPRGDGGSSAGTGEAARASGAGEVPDAGRSRSDRAVAVDRTTAPPSRCTSMAQIWAASVPASTATTISRSARRTIEVTGERPSFQECRESDPRYDYLTSTSSS